MRRLDRITAFQTLTGKVHLLSSRSWGSGPACTEKFAHGSRVEVLVEQVDCKKCLKTVYVEDA